MFVFLVSIRWVGLVNVAAAAISLVVLLFVVFQDPLCAFFCFPLDSLGHVLLFYFYFWEHTRRRAQVWYALL